MGSFDWGAFASSIGGTVLPALGVSPTISGLVQSVGAGFSQPAAAATAAAGWLPGAGPAGQIPGMIPGFPPAGQQAPAPLPPPPIPPPPRPGEQIGGFGYRLSKAGATKYLEYIANEAAMPRQVFQESTTEADIPALMMDRGFVPADSDIGLALKIMGKKVERRQVRYADGTTATIDVIVLKRKRVRRNYATQAGIRNAGRTLRQMGQLVRTYKRLAAQGAKIHRQLAPGRGRSNHVHYRRARATTGRKVTRKR